MRSPEETVCWCCHVRIADIRRAVRQGARTLEEVAVLTGAGEACTKCRSTVRHIVEGCLKQES